MIRSALGSVETQGSRSMSENTKVLAALVIGVLIGALLMLLVLRWTL
jgi:hypothetical protein